MASRTAALPNTWFRRRVADSAAKACWVCYKPSCVVLITGDNKDFFYVCPGHLKDRAFCTPDADEAARAEEKRKKEELELEIEAVKKEFEEKRRKKEERRKEKKGKGKEGDQKKDKKAEEEEDTKDEKEKDEKIKALEKEDATKAEADEGPRIFSLHKNFYQMRVDRIRNAEIAKRNRERLKNPSNFPSVPTGDL